MADEHRTDHQLPMEGDVIDVEEERDQGIYNDEDRDDDLDDDDDLDEPPFTSGDSVVVRPGETDPGSEQPIGGWQGRVTGSMKRTRCWPTSPGTA